MPTIHTPRIIESKYPPEDTNALWVDLSEDEKKKIKSVKKFENGSWVEQLPECKSPDLSSVLAKHLLDIGYTKMTISEVKRLIEFNRMVTFKDIYIFLNYTEDFIGFNPSVTDTPIVKFGSYTESELEDGWSDPSHRCYILTTSNKDDSNQLWFKPSTLDAGHLSRLSININRYSIRIKQHGKVYKALSYKKQKLLYVRYTVDENWRTSDDTEPLIHTIEYVKDNIAFENWSSNNIEFYILQ